VLSNQHASAFSEWALTRLDEGTGQIENLVIDRSFIDRQSGVRWLIDYKNSLPEPDQAPEEFFAQQAGVYRDQLLRYRGAVRELADEPLHCALYFTALGRLHHLPELDLPAVGEQ
jgi:ATP-dependent exoDNAse (exonuclease V) beta subunit